MSKQIRISDTAHENLKRIAWENHRTLAATVELLARLEVDRIRDVGLGPDEGGDETCQECGRPIGLRGPACHRCHDELEAEHDVDDHIYDEPGGDE